MKLSNILAIAIVSFSSIAFGETVIIKPSPAADALVSTAKEMTDAQKSFDAALSKARTTLESSQKEIGTKLQTAQKDLTDKLKLDNKYAPLIANINSLQKQLSDLQDQAQKSFVQSSAPISNEIGKDKALIDGLIPIVRKENGLPGTYTFDSATQKWIETKATETK